jgi:hypothetical protein
VVPLVPTVETRRGAADRKLKMAQGSKEHSNPYSLDGVAEGDVEAAGATTNARNPVNIHSPAKRKAVATSPTEVNVSLPGGEGHSPESGSHGILHTVAATSRGRGAKLVIFNIHGSLLDCSLLAERNPNATIRSSMETRSKRVIFRPWLIEFLRRCFINFNVAFWGSKSEGYMDEIAAVVLSWLKDGQMFEPLFVWSGKQCEPTDFEDGEPICWGKPLSKVFHLWPTFNLSNSVVVDHKCCRLGCNPVANVIIPIPFYIQNMGKIEEDNNYLITSLWPLLEGFFVSSSIEQFRLYYLQSILESDIIVPKLYEAWGHTGMTDLVEGEGTSEPSGFAP